MLYATRSVEVIPIIEFFDGIGTPVYRELTKAGLPEEIEAFPEGYIPTVQGCEWSLNCVTLEAVEDVGWHLHQKPDPRRFTNPDLLRLNSASTLKEQIEILLGSMRVESNYHSNGMYYGKNEVRVLFPNPKSISEMETRICEWGRVMDIVHLVRNSVGRTWKPDRIGFTAPGLPCKEAQEHFGNTRFFGGEPATWITLPITLLATPAKPVALSRNLSQSQHIARESLDEDNLIGPLRSVLPAYFSNGRPSIETAASLANVSTRTLQRRLKESGLTYSLLLDQCAYHLASRMLKDPNNRIIDVAMSLGYQDPSHFARSFKRISGISPTQYRERN